MLLPLFRSIKPVPKSSLGVLKFTWILLHSWNTWAPSQAVSKQARPTDLPGGQNPFSSPTKLDSSCWIWDLYSNRSKGLLCNIHNSHPESFMLARFCSWYFLLYVPQSCCSCSLAQAPQTDWSFCQQLVSFQQAATFEDMTKDWKYLKPLRRTAAGTQCWTVIRTWSLRDLSCSSPRCHRELEMIPPMFQIQVKWKWR